MLILGRGKTWNGYGIGHQSRQAWPDATSLTPEKGRETILWASWHLTNELPPQPRKPPSYMDPVLRQNRASEIQERTPPREWKRARQCLCPACPRKATLHWLGTPKGPCALNGNRGARRALGREDRFWRQAGRFRISGSARNHGECIATSNPHFAPL